MTVLLLHAIRSYLFSCLVILQESKRSSEELCGRNDGNVKVIFPKTDLPVQPGKPQADPITPGDYVLVKVCSNCFWFLLNNANLTDYVIKLNIFV